MIRFIICLTATLSLAACQTSKDIDTAVRAQLVNICAGVAQAKPVIQAAYAAGLISERDNIKVSGAFAALDGPCADPASQTAASVLTAVIIQYGIVSSVLKNAQANKNRS